MTKQQFREHVQRRLSERAQVMYPDNKELQLYYMLGFLTSQLSDTMYDDNKYAAKFLEAIKHNK